MRIRLPARISDDLKWEKERALAESAQKIVWEFDLGIVSIHDEIQFQANAFALDLFTKELHSEKTEKVVLYRGSADFSVQEMADFEEWKRQRPKAREDHLRRLFCADLYANYFQMLAHRLPEEVPIVLAFFEEGCGTRAEREQLLSRERFEHFEMERDVIKEAPWAVCFPEEERCSGEILEKMDRLFEEMEKPFRVIGEPFLTEEWQGVDELFVLSEAISLRGRRKLQGFCAAGGTVVVEGDSLGLVQEIPFRRFRGRGI